MSKNKQVPIRGKLRASPSFALAFSLDGKPYVAKETEPYIQYWLTERYRILLSMFSGPRGATVAQAMESYLRLTGAAPGEAEEKRLRRAIDDMLDAGVLMGVHEDVSRYDERIVEHYLAHRPFPREVTQYMVSAAPITPNGRVLDLAGGPGDLALQLAEISNDVSLMELSKGFLNSATRRAVASGRNLTPLHESCNRLVYCDEEFDVVTVAQALHWLDDVMVCRGVCRVLRPGGSFFVVHSIMDMPDEHPLSSVLGNNSVLGSKARIPFAQEVAPLMRRLTLLFDALDAPDVQRIDLAQRWQAPGSKATSRIVPVGGSLFRQRRPFGMGFARGFLTPAHIEPTGQSPESFWRDLESRCAAASPEQLLGTHNWAVLHFRRGGTPASADALETAEMAQIGF